MVGLEQEEAAHREACTENKKSHKLLSGNTETFMLGKEPAPENKHLEPVAEEKYVLNRGTGIHKRHGEQRIESVCDSCYDSRNVADKGSPVKFYCIHHRICAQQKAATMLRSPPDKNLSS